MVPRVFELPDALKNISMCKGRGISAAEARGDPLLLRKVTTASVGRETGEMMFRKRRGRSRNRYIQDRARTEKGCGLSQGGLGDIVGLGGEKADSPFSIHVCVRRRAMCGKI